MIDFGPMLRQHSIARACRTTKLLILWLGSKKIERGFWDPAVPYKGKSPRSKLLPNSCTLGIKPLTHGMGGFKRQTVACLLSGTLLDVDVNDNSYYLIFPIKTIFNLLCSIE